MYYNVHFSKNALKPLGSDPRWALIFQIIAPNEDLIFTDISGVSKNLFCPIIMHYVTWLEEFNNLFLKDTILLDLPQVQVLITLCGKLFLCEFL